VDFSFKFVVAYVQIAKVGKVAQFLRQGSRHIVFRNIKFGQARHTSDGGRQRPVKPVPLQFQTEKVSKQAYLERQKTGKAVL